AFAQILISFGAPAWTLTLFAIFFAFPLRAAHFLKNVAEFRGGRVQIFDFLSGQFAPVARLQITEFQHPDLRPNQPPARMPEQRPPPPNLALFAFDHDHVERRQPFGSFGYMDNSGRGLALVRQKYTALPFGNRFRRWDAGHDHLVGLGMAE